MTFYLFDDLFPFYLLSIATLFPSSTMQSHWVVLLFFFFVLMLFKVSRLSSIVLEILLLPSFILDQSHVTSVHYFVGGSYI